MFTSREAMSETLSLLIFMSFTTIVTGRLNKCEVNRKEDGSFYRLSGVSRYLHVSNSKDLFRTHKEATSICHNAGFEIAEVNGLSDLVSLSAFIQEDTTYWIGMNDRETSGIYKTAKGQYALFQAFGRGYPADTNCSLGCIYLKQEKGYLHMFDKSCSAKARVLCQFVAGSYCDAHSFQRSAEFTIGGPKQLVHLGKITKNLYVSTVQKPFDDVAIVCAKAKMVPLHFYDHTSAIHELVGGIEHHLLENGLDPETQFWTGGKLEKLASEHYNQRVYWNAIERISNLNEMNSSLFAWAKDEPNDIGGSDSNGCLDISTEVDTKQLILQASNCRVPKFFICMDLSLTTMRESGILLDKKFLQDRQLIPSCFSPEFQEFDPVKINLYQPLSINDTIDLMAFMIRHRIGNGNTRTRVRWNLRWKQALLENIFTICMKAVETEFVPHEMLNIAREMNILYQNSIEMEDLKQADNHAWKPILQVLKACERNVEKYRFTTEGLTVTHFYAGNTSQRGVRIPAEQENENVPTDVFIDVLFTVFTLSVGACYPIASTVGQDSLTWAANYYSLFMFDIARPVTDKWRKEDRSNLLKAGLIVGDVDIRLALYNLKATTLAYHIANDIEDRIMHKPIKAS